jgi:hypothetical protein
MVLAAIDLDQLAVALAPRTGLVDALLAFGPGEPEPVLDHPLPQGLGRDPQVVVLGQLLGGEGRAEIVVALAHQPEHLVAPRRRIAPVAGLAAPLGDQSGRALGAVGLDQTVHLAAAEPEELCRGGAGQAAFDDPLQGIEPRQLHLAHHQHRHDPGPPCEPFHPAAWGTFLSCWSATLLNCAHTAGRITRQYGKEGRAAVSKATFFDSDLAQDQLPVLAKKIEGLLHDRR